MGIEYAWEPSQQPEPLRSRDNSLVMWIRARDLWSCFGTVEIKDWKDYGTLSHYKSWAELPPSLSPITEAWWSCINCK